MLTVCHDNRVRLYPSSIDGASSCSGGVSPRRSIVHNNQTGRWLTTFKAEWHPKREDVFFVGSMSQPRQIDVLDGSTGAQLGPLVGEDLASVCSIVRCHPTMDVVAGGNSSGRVHVFM